VFIVFASVFSAGASGKLDIRAGLVDQTTIAESNRLADGLGKQLGDRLIWLPNIDALEEAIRAGQIDAGVVLRGDLVSTPTPVTVLIHPGRRAAGEVLTAQVLAIAGRDLPELMLRREVARLAPVLALTPEQVQRASAAQAGGAVAPPFADQRVLSGGDPLV